MNIENHQAIRVVIVDDLPIIRAGVRGCLEDVNCFGHPVEVIGVAENGKTAIELILKTKPHMVILDYHLPDMTGYDIYMAFHSKLPKTKVIFLTAANDIKTFKKLFQTEASGFLTKELRLPLDKAIELIFQKKRFIDPCLAISLLSENPELSSLPFLTKALEAENSSSSAFAS